MDEKFMILYNQMVGIDKLSKREYDDFVSRYGAILVDNVIDVLIKQDDRNIFRFEYYLIKKGEEESLLEVDSYNTYLTDLSFTPRLSKEENQFLALSIYDIITKMNFLFSSVSVPSLSPSLKKQQWISDKVEYWLENIDDKDIISDLKKLYSEFIVKRNKLVEGNLRLVVYLARSYKKHFTDITVNELVQFGNVGIMRAVEKYNPSFNTAFSTYAVYWIKQSIKRGIKTTSGILENKPYDLIWLNNGRLTALDALSFELGRNPTNVELANYMGISLSQLSSVEMAMQSPISINSDAIAYADDGAEFFLADCLEDTSVCIERDIVDNSVIEQLMSILNDTDLFSDREKKIILYLNGLIDGKKHTFEDTGKYIGITKQRVKQIEEKAIRRLRCICKMRDINDN